MRCIFKKLGFESSEKVTFGNVEYQLERSWWNSERVEVIIGAHISNQWRHAFLKLGVKPNTEIDE